MGTLVNSALHLIPIPQPKPTPVLKNVPDLEAKEPIQSLMRLARTHGPIFRMSLPTRDLIVVSSQELVSEVCDEKRFDKKVHGTLEQIRDYAGDGLFTAHTQELNWEKAHRILMPAFGPGSIRDMFDPMLDIAEQMLLRWERFGENAHIPVADNFTRLTLDTIALCAFDYRFNSFYQNELHPFVDAMVRSLEESGARTRRLSLQNRLMLFTQRQYETDIRYMHQIADKLISERRNNPLGQSKKDLLGRMLSGRDPLTGEGLSDENIRNQLVTFLIAGHETTSGLLSFALYGLLKNPHILNRAIQEVTDVLGNETPRFEHLSKLVYLDQVIKETLRIWPTAPAFAVYPYEDIVIGGKYLIKKGEEVLILLPMLHRDPKVWKEDVETFDPDRFSSDIFKTLPDHSWKPFGSGQRACIGRPFATQEAQIVLAMILQRFDLFEANPSYQLKIKETLTLKPDGFFVRVRRKTTETSKSKTQTVRPLTSRIINASATNSEDTDNSLKVSKTPLLVLFGSNSGSSEAFAQRIASDAKAQGYGAIIAPLDEFKGQLPTEGALIIVTASYEGQPPDNARQFVGWLETLTSNSLSGVKFAVFGCGNRDWSRTYQAIPKQVDEGLYFAGATRLIERGEADARGDFFGDFDRWYSPLWKVLSETFGHQVKAETFSSLYKVELVKETRSVILRQSDIQTGEIIENRELVNMSAPLARSKRHIEIRLAPGMKYRAGDYLAILPSNHKDHVARALRRFGFEIDSQIVIHKSSDGQTSLPTGYPVNVYEILANYVELAQPATRRHLDLMVQSTECPPEKHKLALLLEEETYKKEILEKRTSVLDLLERFASCFISFGIFLDMLPPMRTRQYSISSSPLWKDTHCTLSLAVVNAPAWSGQGVFNGVASCYLSEAMPGTKVSVTIRPSHAGFHLPDSNETPVIMVAAGSGIAPFRGFIQERAEQIQSGRILGESLLFFGCDHPDVDFIYKDELATWENMGVVNVLPAFSQLSHGEVSFVQHRIWKERAKVMELLNQNARIYVCGDGKRMAPAVRETFIQIYQDAKQCTSDKAELWINNLERTSNRYVTDVFG